MAAVTPASTTRIGSLGMFTLFVFNFTATVNDADTWASGMSGRVFSYWTQDTDNPTTQTSVGVAVAESSGTFTFYPSEDAKTFYLFVLVSGA